MEVGHHRHGEGVSSMRRMPAQPRSEKEARARTVRKLKALKKSNSRYLNDIAGYWDEGPISGAIDGLFSDLDAAIDGVLEAVDEEIRRWAEEPELW
ncbi:hypothetical protein KX928_12735 [Roseobacter sp. YSTF-M11]|uniref:Uncharacterized protein n=1 Tax=Roseobacter insulae TaxID=2859783 RepID=A0A9X1FVU3_9RHOB|nr:hypothetical protein [Roseobacter insulae]MBW4708651.1 hypothetical protein [Roseobacter insulae]